MHLVLRIVAFTALLAVALGAERSNSRGRVSFELITEQGLPVDSPRRWYELFEGLGVSNLQIRSGTGREELEIVPRGTGDSATYKVTGRIRGDNSLLLPGGKFTLRDAAKLKQWIDSVVDEGAEGVTQTRGAFGMTNRQLADVRSDLRRRVTFSTRKISAAEAVDRIESGLKYPLEIDRAATRELAQITIAENLLGLTSGTALAVVLRPAGLVFTPERLKGGEFRYRVGKPVAGQESWPVGWKPDRQERELLPKLFEFIDVEISETSLTDAMTAIEGRLKIPFLWDYNALALHGIDPAKVQVKLPAKKLTYSLILERILFQGRLKKEIRVDEAGKPLVWITTIKPA